MMNIIIKNKSFNKGSAQYRRHRPSGSGFVILFAVTLTSILLAIALGATNIALKEIKFGTSVKDSNDAFLAADTGAECAMINDKFSSNSFVPSGTGSIQCLGGTIPLSGSYPIWSFILSGLGPQGQSCANITVDKTISPTKVISRGYNNGGSAPGSCIQGSNSVERELELNY
jgi:hypothetical protein